MPRPRCMDQPRARGPARTRTNSISSVAYATDERASEEKTASTAGKNLFRVSAFMFVRLSGSV